MQRRRQVISPGRSLHGLPIELTAVVERDGAWHLAYAREISGANGQGRTRDEALESLREAVALILEDRREEARRGIPASSS